MLGRFDYTKNKLFSMVHDTIHKVKITNQGKIFLHKTKEGYPRSSEEEDKELTGKTGSGHRQVIEGDANGQSA